jgi:hypothetical protein
MFHKFTDGSSAVCHVVCGLLTPKTVFVLTSVQRVITAWKASFVVSVVPAPVRLPHFAMSFRVTAAFMHAVFGPQLGIGNA